jgi:hypothetical protein
MQRASLSPRRRTSAAAVLILAGSAAIPACAFAQGVLVEGPEGVDPEAQLSVITATISQSVSSDSNYRLDDDSPGYTTFADTRLGFQLDQDTATRQLAFGFDTGITPIWEAGEPYDTTIASPSTAFFTLVNEGPNTVFDADVSARIRETDFDDPLSIEGDDVGDPDVIELLEGQTREYRYDANIGFELGSNSPSTYAVRFIGSDIDYADNSTDLVPRTTLEGQALWTLRMNPVLSAALFGDYAHFSQDNNAETTVRVAEGEAGFVYEPSEVLLVRAGVGYADREREDNDEVTESDSGPVVRGDIRYILPSLTVSGQARWTTAAPDNRTTFGLRGSYQLARGQVIGRVFNRYTGASGGEEVRVTGAAIGIVRDINNVSRVGLDFSYAFQENLDDTTDPDVTRTDIQATYAYDLTETVAAEVSYLYRTRKDEPIDAASHRVSLTLAKTFETGF